MREFRHTVAFASLLATFASSAVSHAADDPNAPPPSDGTGSVAVPQQDPGTVYVQPQPQPVVVQQQPVMVAQQPPQEQPERRSLLVGAAPSFHLPLLGDYATSGAYGGGLNLHVGYAFGNLSVAFAPALFYYRGPNGSELNLALGAIGRYTFLRDVIIHPYLELGLEYWWNLDGTALAHRDGGLGLDAGIGAELDVSDHVSLQLAARVTGILGDSTITSGFTADLLFTPYLGIAYYR